MAEDTEDTPNYRLGHSDRERLRLIDQAAVMEPRTRRFLIDAGIGSGMRVLDVGCGVGDVCMIAASLVGTEGSVLGVDLDRRSVEWAGRRVEEAGLGNVKFVSSELESLSLDGSFDAVIGRFILMHLTEPAAVLAKLATHLTTDGIVAFQESHFDFPPVAEPEPIALWQQWLDWVVTSSRLGGVDTRMGLKLYRVFLDAGLPAPALHMEVPLFTPEDRLGPRVSAEALRSLLPVLEKFGVATPEEVDVDTFADRLHEEIAAKGAVSTSFGVVSAWSRT